MLLRPPLKERSRSRNGLGKKEIEGQGLRQRCFSRRRKKRRRRTRHSHRRTHRLLHRRHARKQRSPRPPRQSPRRSHQRLISSVLFVRIECDESRSELSLSRIYPNCHPEDIRQACPEDLRVRTCTQISEGGLVSMSATIAQFARCVINTIPMPISTPQSSTTAAQPFAKNPSGRLRKSPATLAVTGAATVSVTAVFAAAPAISAATALVNSARRSTRPTKQYPCRGIVST